MKKKVIHNAKKDMVKGRMQAGRAARMMGVIAVAVVGEGVQAGVMCMAVVFTTVNKRSYLKNMLVRLTFIFRVVN